MKSFAEKIKELHTEFWNQKDNMSPQEIWDAHKEAEDLNNSLEVTYEELNA